MELINFEACNNNHYNIINFSHRDAELKIYTPFPWSAKEVELGYIIKGAEYFVSFFFVALRPNAGHGLLIREVSKSHTKTHHSP